MILDIKSFLFVPRQKSNILTLIYFADFIKKTYILWNLNLINLYIVLSLGKILFLIYFLTKLNFSIISGGTITIPENLSPTNLSMVQPQRISSNRPLQQSISRNPNIFLSDVESSAMAYDLMTPMLSGSFIH